MNYFNRHLYPLTFIHYPLTIIVVSQTGLIIHFLEYTLLVELQLNAIG